MTENLVHPECRQAMRRLMQLKKPSFTDFVELKTYGNDAYSAMGWDELQCYINEETIAIVEQFEEETNILCALRWVARGLPVTYAIRKARADHSMYRYRSP